MERAFSSAGIAFNSRNGLPAVAHSRNGWSSFPLGNRGAVVSLDESESRQALQSIHLFADVLSPDQLNRIAQASTVVTFRAGEALIRQGDTASSMFCIMEGSVSIHLGSGWDRNGEFRRLGAGNVVGEIELLAGGPRLATVTAETNVRALEITKGTLDHAMSDAPNLIDGFSSVLAIRQAMLRQLVPPQRSRLARILGQIRKFLSH
jgi:CRP-like cAMP-binding protein